MTLGEKFRKARRLADLTQTQVAEAVGVSKAFICRIETGYAKFPADRLAQLPAPIRDVVIEAMIEESHETIERLRATRERLARA